MKCIKKTNDEIVRVSDQKARELVSAGNGKYVSKSEWKAQRSSGGEG